VKTGGETFFIFTLFIWQVRCWNTSVWPWSLARLFSVCQPMDPPETWDTWAGVPGSAL